MIINAINSLTSFDIIYEPHTNSYPTHYVYSNIPVITTEQIFFKRKASHDALLNAMYYIPKAVSLELRLKRKLRKISLHRLPRF